MDRKLASLICVLLIYILADVPVEAGPLGCQFWEWDCQVQSNMFTQKPPTLEPTIPYIFIPAEPQEDNQEEDTTVCTDEKTGNKYKDGESIPRDEPCVHCSCHGNQIACAKQACAFLPPKPGCQAVKVEGQCCPRMECPQVCTDDKTGKKYKDGESIPRDDPCVYCSCHGNQIVCAIQDCAFSPPQPGCQTVKVEGQCCPQMECPQVCTDDKTGKKYKDGESIPRDDPCVYCSCHGNQIVCAIQDCAFLPPQPGCHTVTEPGQCCPRMECPKDADDVKQNRKNKRKNRKKNRKNRKKNKNKKNVDEPK